MSPRGVITVAIATHLFDKVSHGSFNGVTSTPDGQLSVEFCAWIRRLIASAYKRIRAECSRESRDEFFGENSIKVF